MHSFYDGIKASQFEQQDFYVTGEFGDWDKSSIKVTGICSEPNAVFTILNSGKPDEGDMDGPSEYRIYRNNILEEIINFQINGGESIEMSVYGGGWIIFV